MKPAAVTPSDVRRYVTLLVAEGRISVKTINNSLAVLRVFFAHLEEDGDVVRNLARSSRGARERIKLPADQREMDYLRLEEIPRYLDACGDLYRPRAETLIATGVRISEALALTWDDVDFATRTLRIVRSRKAEGRGSTKGDRFRSVDFGARLEAVLRALRGAGEPGRARRSCSAARAAASCRAPTCRATFTSTRSRTRRCERRCACTTCATRPPRRGWPPDSP